MTNSLQHRKEVLLDRVGYKLASRLSAGTQDLPYEVSERLRAARMQALGHRKVAVRQVAHAVHANGGAATLSFGDEGLGWGNRIASLVPLIALVVGLVGINAFLNDHRAQEVAEVDAALLADELPPTAYADSGFIQYLKSSQESGH